MINPLKAAILVALLPEQPQHDHGKELGDAGIAGEQQVNEHSRSVDRQTQRYHGQHQHHGSGNFSSGTPEQFPGSQSRQTILRVNSIDVERIRSAAGIMQASAPAPPPVPAPTRAKSAGR